MRLRIRFRAAGAVIACVCVYCSKPSPLSPPVAATCYVTSLATNGGGDPSVYTYDANHQLLAPMDANGVPLWTAVYDQGDKRALRTGTRIDTLFFDANRRLTQRVVSYDSGKNVGEIHTFHYNSFGQLKSSTDAYFAAGVQVPASVDTISYEYPDPNTHNYAKATSVGTGGAGITLYSYDNKNNPWLVTNSPLSFWYNPTVTTNNVTRLETIGGWNHVENYAFTYSEYGYPITRSGVNENNGPWKEYYTYTDCSFNP